MSDDEGTWVKVTDRFRLTHDPGSWLDGKCGTVSYIDDIGQHVSVVSIPSGVCSDVLGDENFLSFNWQRDVRLEEEDLTTLVGTEVIKNSSRFTFLLNYTQKSGIVQGNGFVYDLFHCSGKFCFGVEGAILLFRNECGDVPGSRELRGGCT